MLDESSGATISVAVHKTSSSWFGHDLLLRVQRFVLKHEKSTPIPPSSTSSSHQQDFHHPHHATMRDMLIHCCHAVRSATFDPLSISVAGSLPDKFSPPKFLKHEDDDYECHDRQQQPRSATSFSQRAHHLFQESLFKDSSSSSSSTSLNLLKERRPPCHEEENDQISQKENHRKHHDHHHCHISLPNCESFPALFRWPFFPLSSSDMCSILKRTTGQGGILADKNKPSIIPEIKFEKTSVQVDKLPFSINGNLTLIGKTKEVSCGVFLTPDLRTRDLSVVFQCPVDSTEWGIPRANVLGLIETESEVLVEVAIPISNLGL